MLDPHWVFVSAVLGLAGSVRYAFSTMRGTARPNLVTWSLWAAAPLIGFFAQLDAGVGMPAVQTLAAGVGPLAVVVCAVLTRHNLARLGTFDVVCAVIAVVALGVWLGLGQAPLAVVCAVAADAAAALPTALKAWRDPYSENLLFYVLVGTGAAVTLLTITSWQPEAWAFAVYVLALCAVLVSIVSVRRRAPHRAQPGRVSRV
ncbi:hypothetical protein MMF93_32725 [Streptomyces tubbatahanensis]|uniref:Uncharacterized protein n=1 Tax=Streptomyces tubbatahanensis TaxID=2923272 RepID=A0ABY3Y273_9ACTN|nr:hypothetical protein [Streptomyces tubbatahanensis]UNT00721.1 hypothetical protein MMF93_32725 [Streptomyces tubbatahanensis]